MSKLVELPDARYRSDAFYGFSVAPSFSIGTARAAAWLSQLAYESNWNKIKSILERWGLQLITPIDRPLESILPMVRTRGFTANGPDATFIVFSGTDPLVLEHWITDFSFLPSPEGIHHGFQRAAEVAWADVQRAAGDAIASNRKLFLVGHSLGAAIAAISALRLQHRSPEPVEASAIYVFGMPRAGGDKFVNSYGKLLGDRTYRLIHGDDIVTTVPPPNLGFRHAGRMIRCDRFGSFEHVSLSSAWDVNTPDFAPEALEKLQKGLGDILSGRLYTDGGLADVLSGRLRAIEVVGSNLVGRLRAVEGAMKIGLSFPLLPPLIGDHLPDRYLHAVG